MSANVRRRSLRAQIPHERLVGRARTARLDVGERNLYPGSFLEFRAR